MQAIQLSRRVSPLWLPSQEYYTVEPQPPPTKIALPPHEAVGVVTHHDNCLPSQAERHFFLAFHGGIWGTFLCAFPSLGL